TEFNMTYLSGNMADKYYQEPHELTGRVYERMEQSVKDCFQASVKGYATEEVRSAQYLNLHNC
ncbi:hypothetical protein PZH33_19450, partial [Blautia schinkii]|nr:hypothetical protein [Blautia schinkii]